jgi:rhodanese-related sulfurtransferase
MHFLNLLSAATVISISISLAACNPNSKSETSITSQPSETAAPATITPDMHAMDAAENASNSEFKRINVKDAHKAISEGKAVMVDVRSEDAYKVSHIKGAHLVSTDKIVEHSKEHFKGKQVITYCSCPDEATSGRATKKLTENGMDSAALVGGIDAWKKAGYPVESSK